MPGLERQAHGRTTSKSWMTGKIAEKNTEKEENPLESAYFLSNSRIKTLCNTQVRQAASAEFFDANLLYPLNLDGPRKPPWHLSGTHTLPSRGCSTEVPPDPKAQPSRQAGHSITMPQAGHQAIVLGSIDQAAWCLSAGEVLS